MILVLFVLMAVTFVVAVVLLLNAWVIQERVQRLETQAVCLDLQLEALTLKLLTSEELGVLNADLEATRYGRHSRSGAGGAGD